MLCFPLPSSYGVAQIDIHSTFLGLHPDEEALSAARALDPKRYLVYLQNVRQLPFPQQRDFKYSIYLVGAGLRPDNEAKCITADMCAPIFPNTVHPTGRSPVHATPQFPFSDCFHWFGGDTELEVRVKNGVYDPPPGKTYYELPSEEHAHLECYKQDDNSRIRALCAKRKRNTAESFVVTDGSAVGQRASIDYQASTPVTDIFGLDFDANRDLIPVVDLWLDLPEYMEQDDIPDPMDLVAECKALSGIIEDLKQRQWLALQSGAVAIGSIDPKITGCEDESVEDKGARIKNPDPVTSLIMAV